MSIEAFLWNYRDGQSIGFDFTTVRAILSTEDADWLDEHGCLRVHFRQPDDDVDIYLGKSAPALNHIDGITIARSIVHSDYLSRILRVMELGNVMLFYSDETTPVFLRGADPGHYPADLLAELGQPRFVTLPSELLHQT
jgi:hypothetical protein